MKLSGIIQYKVPYCTSYFKIFICIILGFPRGKHGLCHYNICGDPSLIHFSSKTGEQNFMKLSGIVHYMVPYCSSYFKFLFEWFWGFPQQNIDFVQGLVEWEGTISHLLLIKVFKEFHQPYRFYMLHDDIPHTYYTFWFDWFLDFPL